MTASLSELDTHLGLVRGTVTLLEDDIAANGSRIDDLRDSVSNMSISMVQITEFEFLSSAVGDFADITELSASVSNMSVSLVGMASHLREPVRCW